MGIKFLYELFGCEIVLIRVQVYVWVLWMCEWLDWGAYNLIECLKPVLCELLV